MAERQVWIGIDVAKAELEVAVSEEATTQRWRNDEDGIAALVTALHAQTPQLIVLEATGGMRRR